MDAFEARAKAQADMVRRVSGAVQYEDAPAATPYMPNEGLKFDGGKDPWQLIPWDAVRAITKVLRFGAEKYAPRNWEKGMDWDRLFRAAIEHLNTWFMEGTPDKETGFSHLWHAGCCILFLIAYELRGVGRDTRPIPNPVPPAELPPDEHAIMSKLAAAEPGQIVNVDFDEMQALIKFCARQVDSTRRA